MSSPLSPHDIYEHERAKWISAAGRRKTFLDRFKSAQPYLLIVIQVAMFLVSAKHTSDMINLIAPGMGGAGVVGFELGLVVFSLLIYQTRRTDGVVARLWQILEYIMAFMIILSNIAGSIDAIVATTGIQTLSFAAVAQAFGGLPLATQTALVVGLAFAVGVPLLFIGTGQAFAHMILSQVDGSDPMEALWLSNGYPNVYRAFFAHFTEQGLRPTEAKQAAKQMASGFLGGRVSDVRSPVSDARPPLSVAVRPDAPQVSAASLPSTVHSPVRSAPADGTDKRGQVVRWLSDHPEEADTISVRRLAEATDVSKTTAHEVLTDWRRARA